MSSAGDECGGTGLLPLGDGGPAHGKIDDCGTGDDDQTDIELLDLARIEEGQYGFVNDESSCHEDHGPFDDSGDVLYLSVSEWMRLVRGLCRQIQCVESDECGHHIHYGFQSVRQDGDGTRQIICDELDRHQQKADYRNNLLKIEVGLCRIIHGQRNVFSV